MAVLEKGKSDTFACHPSKLSNGPLPPQEGKLVGQNQNITFWVTLKEQWHLGLQQSTTSSALQLCGIYREQQQQTNKKTNAGNSRAFNQKTMCHVATCHEHLLRVRHCGECWWQTRHSLCPCKGWRNNQISSVWEPVRIPDQKATGKAGFWRRVPS